MKMEWTVLIISALTDAIIAFGTGLMVGNSATGTVYPTGPTLLYSAIGSIVVGARTVQQSMKTIIASKNQPQPEVVAAVSQP